MTQVGRRTPRAVRLTLATNLGSGIDGAWWPRGSAVAGELVELVSALEPRLGTIADIAINWRAGEGAAALHAIATGEGPVTGSRRPRLISLMGKVCSARLLVVPSTTSKEIAVLVLARSARAATAAAPTCWADGVISAAHTESLRWPIHSKT
ncbi:DUF5994 family protein [Mycolicibacterium sp. 120266]|uniref:DUF5994 family protein n=1 Tax=Mycolicibacterium sp. 120266 TaxID=3090601 RepID=UPI0039A66980